MYFDNKPPFSISFLINQIRVSKIQNMQYNLTRNPQLLSYSNSKRVFGKLINNFRLLSSVLRKITIRYASCCNKIVTCQIHKSTAKT